MRMTQDKPGPLAAGEPAWLPLSQTHGYEPELGGVPDEQREGVFVHSFICNRCGLHFNVYSWLRDRHTVKSIFCPECGQHDGRFRHCRVQVGELTAADLKRDPKAFMYGTGEIYRFCPLPGAAAMSDTTLAGLKPAKE